MNILSIFQIISPIFRRKRMAWFLDQMKLKNEVRILDVGGRANFWNELHQEVKLLDIVNVEGDRRSLTPVDSRQWMRVGYGNALDLDFEDKSYDLVFSNSVIEHVQTWENQVKFAREADRVGKALWVQTPAREFFIEPHYIAPFIHWVPVPLRRKLIRWFTIWGWMERPSQQRVDEVIAEIRLLSVKEFQTLFPKCEILRERFLGIFTKSYIAVRRPSETLEEYVVPENSSTENDRSFSTTSV
jgi:SAM-dependent methyltransferase